MKINRSLFRFYMAYQNLLQKVLISKTNRITKIFKFSIILGIIFFAELVAGILGFVYKGWFETKFDSFMSTTIAKYRDDPDLQNLIDFSQSFVSQFSFMGNMCPTSDWFI